MNRRELFNTALTAATASVLLPKRTWGDEVGDEESPRIRIIDTNISLFQWPFRRLPLDDVKLLVRKLRSLGIVEAWAGSFEAILHRDLAGVNRRLADACARHPELVPVGSVNPELPGWQDDLRRCVGEHNMPGVRLHPNYHGYTLDDRRFVRLLELAVEVGRFVQIAVAIEDTRTQHPLVQARDVDLAPLPDVMRDMPAARVQILNERPSSALLERLAGIPGIFFDTARVEGTDGIAKLLQSLPPGRVMFGSHAPFLVPEAALIRVHESDLGVGEHRSLLSENASSLENR